jgi:hypothetical protein
MSDWEQADPSSGKLGVDFLVLFDKVLLVLKNLA